MIRYNLTICSYCFFLYALVVISNALLTSSCTVHSRKFPTKPSVHTYKFFHVIRYRFSSSLAFPFLDFNCFFALGFWDLTIDQLLPSRFYPIVSKTFSTCTGFSSCSSACYKVSTNYTLVFEYL